MDILCCGHTLFDNIIFFSHFLAICKDEIGNNYIIKNQEDWQASPCVKCNCKGGMLSCQREITVFFPYSSQFIYSLTEVCTRPSCNVFHFLRDKAQTCEGNMFNNLKFARELNEKDIKFPWLPAPKF